MGVLLILGVEIVEKAVHRKRTSRLAQPHAVNGRSIDAVTVSEGILEIVDDAVTAFAELSPVSRTERIVRLKTQARADHQRLVVRDFPFDAGIQAVVEILCPGITVGEKRIDRCRILVPALGTRPIDRTGSVEEVAALESHLIPAAPGIRIIDTHCIYRSHAVLVTNHILSHATAEATAAMSSAGIARNTQNILERKVLLIDVVKKTDQRQTAGAAKKIDVAADHILVFGFGFRVGVVTVTGICLTEYALTHIFACDDVDRLITFAVVHTRKLGLVAQLVVNLDPFDRFGRQGLDRRCHVLAEKLLAIDEYFLDRFALRLDSAVIDRNAGHLLQQPLDVGIGSHLERIGIIAYRIALLRSAECLHLLHYGLDGDGRLPQCDLSQVFGRLRHPKLLFGLFISHESHGQGI